MSASPIRLLYCGDIQTGPRPGVTQVSRSWCSTRACRPNSWLRSRSRRTSGWSRSPTTSSGAGAVGSLDDDVVVFWVTSAPAPRNRPDRPGLRCPRRRPRTPRLLGPSNPADKDIPRGPDGVPGEGALRQARSHDHPRHRGHHARGGESRGRGVRLLRGQGPGQGRRPRQGRRRQAGQDARRGLRARVEHPRDGDQGAHRQPGPGHPGHAAGGGVLLLLPARPRQPAVPLHRQRRGRRGDRGGRQDQPRGRPADPDRPGHRRRRGEGPRDRRRGEVPRPSSSTRPCRWCWRSGQVFVEEDATLVEVNPLARLEGDKLEALDGKVSLDENAEFRHPDHAAFEIKDETDPLEAKAKEKGLNYVKLDGEVGIIGNGAGPGHVHPRRGRVRRRAARRRQAGELPRHRRRRQRPGDGRRPRRDPPRRAGQVRCS